MYPSLGIYFLLFSIFYSIRGSILELQKKILIFNDTLSDKETLEHFSFGYAQFNPLLKEACTETCKAVGDFVSCAFPMGEFQVPGFLLGYNSNNEKEINKIISGYSLIPTVSDDFCFCQKSGLALAFRNEYQALKMGFDYFTLYVTETVNVFHETILRSDLTHLKLDPTFMLIKAVYNLSLLPLYVWCQEKEILDFNKAEGSLSVELLDELVEKIEGFKRGLTELTASYLYTNGINIQSIKNIIQKIDFSKPLSILYALQYRAQFYGFGLHYHSCGEETRF